MEANVQLPTPSRPRFSEPLVSRVTDLLAASQSTGVWVRGSGRHLLLGLQGQAPFARLTAFGCGSFGLAFQSTEHGNQWQLLLVDDLAGVIEHALVACAVDRT